MSKLRKSARGQECQIRLPGICNGNPETTVLCHLGGAGMGMKSNDIHGAFGCSCCHDVIDGRVNAYYDRDFLKLAHMEGVIRTQAIWIKQGLIGVQ